MANRYWVGHTGDWGDSANWSATSGGTGGVSVPGGSDSVRFDANSFSANGQRVHYSGSAGDGCADLDATGVTFNSGLVFDVPPITAYQFDLGGNLTIPSNFSITSAGSNFKKGVLVITGPTMLGNYAEIDVGGNTLDLLQLDFGNNVKLTSDFSVNGLLGFLVGASNTFDANGFNVTVTGTIIGNFVNEGIFTYDEGTIKMGSGTWTASGIFWDSGMFPTIDCGTSTLILGTSNPGDITGMLFTNETDTTFYNLEIPANKYLDLYRHLILTVGGLKSSGHLTFNNISVGGGVRLNFFSGVTTTVTGTLTANGSAGSEITFRSSTSGVQTTLSAPIATLSFVDVKDNVAAGVAIPFLDVAGGVDSGNNVNWIFSSANLNRFLQNVFLVFSDPNGDVQLVGAGTTDNTAPVYYELETQTLDFGDRSHLKKVSDQIVVFTNNGQESVLQSSEDGRDYNPIPLNLSERVNIGEKINLEGNGFKFKWSGNTTTTSPVFEGLYLENITDLGMTYE